MAKAPCKTWTRRPREFSPSLTGLAFLFFLAAQAPAAVWYLNDTQTIGDTLTRAAGNDQTGDGSENKPFLSLDRALQSAGAGDTLRLDAGDYLIPCVGASPADKKTAPILLSRLSLEGRGPGKTRLHAAGKAGLVFAGGSGIQLRDFSIDGGDSCLELDHCREASLLRIKTTNSRVFGILLKDSEQNKLEACSTANSGFRGIQLRRSNHNILSGHTAPGNRNAGYCLETSSDNRLQNCLSQNNGMSGFYLFRKSDRNRLEKCTATQNKFVGFYLDRASTLNDLVENNSNHNDRGFTLKDSPHNFLAKNQAAVNQSCGFWIKDKSASSRFEGNLAENNGDSGFSFTPDSPAAVFEKNRSQNNGASDLLETAPTTVGSL